MLDHEDVVPPELPHKTASGNVDAAAREKVRGPWITQKVHSGSRWMQTFKVGVFNLIPGL